MLRVDVYRFFDSKNGRLKMWFTWKPGNKYAKMHVAKSVSAKIAKRWIAEIEAEGIVGKLSKVYMLSDGKDFMEQVQYQYRNFVAMAGPPYKTKNGEHIRYPISEPVKRIEVGTNYKKAEREKKRLQDDGFRVSIRETDNPPYEYTVVGVKVGKKKK